MRFVMVLACLTGLAVVIQAVARPVYRKAKVLRARSAAREASDLMVADKLEEASRHSRLAYEFAPDKPEVLRVVARLSTRLGHPDAFARHQAFAATGRADLTDRIEMAELAVRTGRTDAARPLLTVLMKEVPTDRRVWRLAQRQVRQLGDLTQAIQLARVVVSRFASDSEAELELATLLLLTGEPVRVEEGIRILWGVALSRSPSQRNAVAILARRPSLKPSEAETLARVLDGSAGASVSLTSVLLSCQLRLRSHPEKRLEWLARALRSVPTNAPVPEVCELVLWLGEHDAVSLADVYLPPERCRTNFALMAARLDFLMGMGRDEEFLQAVFDPANVLDSGTRAAAQGTLAARQGRRDEAERAFRGALDEAGARSHLVAPLVAREAERHGFNAVAVQALQLQMKTPGAGLEAARRILRLLRTEPDLREALVTLRRLHVLLPGDDTVVRERVWHELFMGENSEWALAELKRRSAEQPSDATFLPALAFAHWRAGNAAEALVTIESASPDPARLSPREKVVYALLLGANNQREAARRVARMIPPESMRKQFGELLAPWL